MVSFNLARRVQLCLLFAMMLVTGIAELVSLGAVLPFLTVLSDPQQLWQNTLVSFFYSAGVYRSECSFAAIHRSFYGGGCFAALIRLLNLWLNGRLAAAIGSDLSFEAIGALFISPILYTCKGIVLPLFILLPKMLVER